MKSLKEVHVMLSVLLTALALRPTRLPYHHGFNHVPYYATWGPYRIIIKQRGHNENGNPQEMCIQDQHGHTLRRIRANWIYSVEEIRLIGHAALDLHIFLWSGGAYSAFTEVYFTRRHGLRNLLVFDGEDLGVKSVIDLNSDGIPEIIAENPVLGDFSAYHFHRHWPLITILQWNGRRYADATRHFPQRSLKEARARRDAILRSRQYPDERPEWDIEDQITAYYANMLAIGRGKDARRWLRKHVTAHEWNWVKQHERELRRIVATAASRRAYVTQAAVIEQR
jgi:hypothetical protein